MALATAAAVAGTAVAIGSAGMSFTQAAKSKKKAKEANKAAEEAIEGAKKKLSVNYTDSLSIYKDPYEQEREANNVVAAQSLIQAQEAKRGAAATAGRVMQSNQQQQAKTRARMGMDILNLEKAKAMEDARLRDEMVRMDKMEAQGAQIAAMNEEEARRQAVNQGVQSLGNAALQGAKIPNLYGKGDARQMAKQFENVTADSMGGLTDFEGVDVSGFGGMDKGARMEFLMSQDPEWVKRFRGQFSNFGDYNPQLQQMKGSGVNIGLDPLPTAPPLR